MYFGFLGNQTQTGLHNSFLDIFLQNITQLELHLNKKKKKKTKRERKPQPNTQTTPTKPQKNHTPNYFPQRQATELILHCALVLISPHCKPIE